MPIPTTTAPSPNDTLAISLMKINMLLGGAPASGDNAARSAQKANGALVSGGMGIPEAPLTGLVYGRRSGGWAAINEFTGPWTEVPVDSGYAGGVSTVQGRWIIHPTNGLIQLKGTISGGADWGSSQQIVANLPLQFRPANTRYLSVLSGSGTSLADSMSILAVAIGGQLVLYSFAGFTYSVAPSRANFDSVLYSMNVV